jgi:hypothetical protein
VLSIALSKLCLLCVVVCLRGINSCCILSKLLTYTHQLENEEDNAAAKLIWHSLNQNPVSSRCRKAAYTCSLKPHALVA